MIKRLTDFTVVSLWTTVSVDRRSVNVNLLRMCMQRSHLRRMPLVWHCLNCRICSVNRRYVVHWYVFSFKCVSMYTRVRIRTIRIHIRLTRNLFLFHRHSHHHLYWKLAKCNLYAKETHRCDRSHIFPDHPRCATPMKVVIWGGVPDIVNHVEFHQSWFGGLAPWGVKICYFPMLHAMAYITV